MVVNHHLFLADLKLKSAGHGEALPRYQAVVFDEAHLLPEIATQAFGVSVSERRLKTLARDVLQEAPRVAEQIRAVNQAGSGFFAALHKLAGPGGDPLLPRGTIWKAWPCWPLPWARPWINWPTAWATMKRKRPFPSGPTPMPWT